MNDSFKLAMQLTMTDMLSSAAQVARRHILSLGTAGKEIQRDFDIATTHITRGLKAISVTSYGLNKIKPGVAAAADLQENLIDVRMSLMRSGKDAATLGRELDQVRATAVDLQKITPFSASDVTQTIKELLNSGVEFENVVGKGATRAALALATITKGEPYQAASAMLSVGVPYQLKGKEYLEVADVLQKHIMSGRLKLPEWVHNLPRVAGVAHQFKVPWEDMITGLAVIGEQGFKEDAGTYLKDFYERLTGASRISRRVMSSVNQDLIGKGKTPLEFWDKKGELLSTQQIIKNLRGSLGSYNTHQRMFILSKIFGEQGGQGALALMSQGVGSWEFVKQKLREVADAEDKMTERLKGLNANVMAFKTNMSSTAATIFNPWLEPLTQITKGANDAADAVRKFADTHPKTNDTVNGLLAASIATAGGYGLISLLRGGAAGARALRGLKSLGGTGLGIAEGKAIQAATGVQSVFVVNWPGSLGGAVATTAAGAAGAAGGAGRMLPWLAAAGSYALPVAIAAAPFVGKALSDAARDNGWGTRTIRHDSSEYEVMGIGGHKRPINLTVQIDSQGRVFSRSDDPAARFSTVKRGAFFEDMMTSH